jgi:hypothetical protein
MSKRANALATLIEQGAETLAAFSESLSEVEWQTVVPNEGRPAGVVVHHVAVLCPMLVDMARGLAEGKPITGMTWDHVHQMNGQHAQEHAAVGQQETVALLRANSKAAAERVRGFIDEELDNGATVCLYADTPLTSQAFIEFHSILHNYAHLASIRAALSGKA